MAVPTHGITVQRYQKKPLTIEAICWTGQNLLEIAEWMGQNPDTLETQNVLRIPTLEGTMNCALGSWIIKGVEGEFYPCKAEIFTKTYDRLCGE